MTVGAIIGGGTSITHLGTQVPTYLPNYVLNCVA